METHMKIEEANRIIAEYMGIETHTHEDGEVVKLIREREGIYTTMLRYSVSLDALVPVWEKMFNKGMMELCLMGNYNGYWLDFNIMGRLVKDANIAYKPIQQAACIATARAIEELNESNV